MLFATKSAKVPFGVERIDSVSCFNISVFLFVCFLLLLLFFRLFFCLFCITTTVFVNSVDQDKTPSTRPV